MRVWHTDETQKHELALLLNRIEQNGGEVFAILPSERAQHLIVIWFK